MNTTICPNPDVLADYVLGRVSEADLTGIASHVEACPTCQSQLETLDGLSDTVVTCLRRAAALDQADPDDSLLEEVLSRIGSITSGSGPDSHDHVHTAILPRQLGQYQLVEELGHGGMGDVYKAFHTKLKRTVAVKLLPAHRQRSPQAVSRFLREMEAVGRVDHPNIVRAHDAGEADGQFFLAMECVEGVTLASLVRRLGPLGVADACEIVRQAAVGLQHVHEHGLVHRDVKPSNLMLTTTGVVKVLDLGLARLHVEECGYGDATASNLMMGSVDYMAPEQGSNPRDADARADLYSLGCTLYFSLAGRPPFGDQRHNTFLAKLMAHAKEDVGPIDQVRSDVPGQLTAVLNRMLAKSPASRCATAAEVAESLTPFCAGSDLVRLLTDRGATRPITPIATGVTDSYLPDSPLKSSEASAVPAAVATHKAWQIGLRLGSWRVFSFSWELSTRTVLQIGVGLVLLATAGLWYGSGFLAPRQGIPIARYSPDQDLTGRKTAQLPSAQGPTEPQGDRTPGLRSEPRILPSPPSPFWRTPNSEKGVAPPPTHQERTDDKDVRFHLDCERARQSFGDGRLVDALTNVQDALQVRPEDKEAADLRDKIQTDLDKAEAEQHRRKAESAIIAEDLRGAVEEIVKAREILERPGNATWGAAKRGVLDELAKTLIGKLHEQATVLSDKRQYRKAEAAVARGQRLSPNDEKLAELLGKIKDLKADPKSANISGGWVYQVGGNVMTMGLKDTGADTVAWSLTGDGQQSSGSFTRMGAGLEGTSPVPDGSGQLTVKARIESPDTIVVQSRVFTPNNKKLPPQHDNTKYTWTRRAAEETATPDDADEPSARPSGSRPTPQRPRRTQRDPFGPPDRNPMGIQVAQLSTTQDDVHRQGSPKASAEAPPGGQPQDTAGQNVEAVSTYLRRTTLPEPIRAAMLTVVRQHPGETRWSGRAGTTLFGIAAKRLPKEPLAQRAIPAMLELTHMWAVHELLTAKSLLGRYSALGLNDATTLRQAVVEAAGKLQVSGKASTVTHQASTEGNLAIGYAVADEAALTAQLLQPDEIEKVRIAYRDVMHRQARELMQRSNWTDALLLWQHLHKRQLVSQQLYLDAACCFKQLNQVPDMILVLSEAIDTFGKSATPEFLEKAGDMALTVETEQAQALAAKAYRMASEQLNETISTGGEHAAQADQQR